MKVKHNNAHHICQLNIIRLVNFYILTFNHFMISGVTSHKATKIMILSGHEFNQIENAPRLGFTASDNARPNAKMAYSTIAAVSLLICG